MKKIISSILSLCFITPCFAEDNMTADIAVKDDVITAVICVPDADISHELSIRVEDGEGNINYIDFVYTNEDKKAEFLYENFGKTGEYVLSVYSPERQELLEEHFNFYDETYRKNVIYEFNKINSNKASLSEFIATYSDMLTVSDVYSDITDESGFDALFIKRNISASSISEISEIINDTVFLAILSEKDNAEDVEILLSGDYKSYIEFVKGGTGEPLLYSFNREIQNKFYEEIAKSTFTSKDELQEKIKSALLTNAVRYANLYTETMLALKSYNDNGLIKLSNKYEMEDVSKSLTGKSYASLIDIQTAYNKYTPSSSKGTSGGGGSSGGGSSSGKTSGITAYTPNTPDTSASSEVKEQKNIFTDVELTMWAASYITKAVDAGILVGMGDGTFNPSGNLTRAQAAVIMSKLSSIEPKNEDFGFNDVSKNDWYYEYVGAVCSAGIFNGLSNNIFGPDETLNREQAAVIFWRYLENKGFEYTESELTFDDAKDISPWAKNAVSALVQHKIITGKTDKLFAPDRPLLRAEAAVIVSKIIDITNR